MPIMLLIITLKHGISQFNHGVTTSTLFLLKILTPTRLLQKAKCFQNLEHLADHAYLGLISTSRFSLSNRRLAFRLLRLMCAIQFEQMAFFPRGT